MIAEHIDSFTKILAGGGKGFSNNDDFIEIKLSGPKMPDPTIIDLPGIVRTEVDGQEKGAREEHAHALPRAEAHNYPCCRSIEC